MGLRERVIAPFGRFERAVGPPDWSSYEAPDLAVRALNSARGWQFRLNWSKGAVSRGQAERTASSLRAASPNAVRIVACHHPLIEVPHGPMTARVHGGRHAAERLVHAGADIVLTGHLHAPFVHPLPFGDGLTFAIGASTLSQRERGARPGFNRIDVDGDQLTVTALGWTGLALEVQQVWEVQLRSRRSAVEAFS